MGAGPSALEVAAHYDGAGKVVVITGANSGIGAIAFHIITANPRRAELFQGKEAARVLAIRSAAAGVCVPCAMSLDSCATGAAPLSCVSATRDGATRRRQKYKLQCRQPSSTSWFAPRQYSERS